MHYIHEGRVNDADAAHVILFCVLSLSYLLGHCFVIDIRLLDDAVDIGQVIACYCLLFRHWILSLLLKFLFGFSFIGD